MTSCLESGLSDLPSPVYSHSDQVPLGVTRQKLPAPTRPGQLASTGGDRTVLPGAGQEEPALGNELRHARLCHVHSAPGSASAEAHSLQERPPSRLPGSGQRTEATRAVVYSESCDPLWPGSKSELCPCDVG